MARKLRLNLSRLAAFMDRQMGADRVAVMVVMVA
jgi:hypothetical protein